MLAYPPDEHISITFFHSQTLAEELKRNADSLTPRFALSTLILVVFCVLCNMSMCRDGSGVDWVVSKPWLGIFGVVNAGMGVVSSIGSLALVGFSYNDIVGVMPFLVVGEYDIFTVSVNYCRKNMFFL